MLNIFCLNYLNNIYHSWINILYNVCINIIWITWSQRTLSWLVIKHHWLNIFSDYVQCRQTLTKPSSAKQPMRRTALLRLRRQEKASDPLVKLNIAFLENFKSLRRKKKLDWFFGNIFKKQIVIKSFSCWNWVKCCK